MSSERAGLRSHTHSFDYHQSRCAETGLYPPNCQEHTQCPTVDECSCGFRRGPAPANPAPAAGDYRCDYRCSLPDDHAGPHLFPTHTLSAAPPPSAAREEILAVLLGVDAKAREGEALREQIAVIRTGVGNPANPEQIVLLDLTTKVGRLLDAVDAVLAYGASPPGYPGLALVPQPDLERLRAAIGRAFLAASGESEE